MDEEIKEQQAQQAGKDIADVVGKGASTYIGGAAGAVAYDKFSNSKIGQQVLNNAGTQLSQSTLGKEALSRMQPDIKKIKPMAKAAAGGLENNPDNTDLNEKSNKSNPINSSLSNPDNYNPNDNETSDSRSLFGSSFTLSKKNKIILKYVLPIALAILGVIFFVAIIVSIVMSGFEFVNNDDKDSNKLLNFITGCGWTSDEECRIRKENDFYQEIEEQYEYYKEEYEVEIDKNLLIATLTYSNPFLTGMPEIKFDENGEIIDAPTSTIDYKKSKKQIKKLINEMVKCYIGDKEIECRNKIAYVGKDIIIEMDYEGYRTYLENTFVIDYYLEGKDDEESRQKSLDITEEIYQRKELYEYLNGVESHPNNFASNNTTITITDNNGILLERVTLSEYLQGVVYAQGDSDDSIEYLKFVAVAAKNYLYRVNNANIDNMPQNLRISNSDSSLSYCSITEGCHYMSGSDNLSTGPSIDGKYYKFPINDVDFLKLIKQAVDETMSDFLIENDSIVETYYNGKNKEEILLKLSNSSYMDVLSEIYGGNIQEVTLFAIGYPLDLQWTKVTSGYGWRFHPNNKVCKHHNGTDIAASSYSNIYSIADGVVTYTETNYGTLGYGNYVVIGHGNYIDGHYEYYSLYAHQVKAPIVKKGDLVKAGQLIGYVGSTGNSTGPHLHIEIYTLDENGKRLRQDPVLSFKNVQLTGVIGPMYDSEKQCKSSN